MHPCTTMPDTSKSGTERVIQSFRPGTYTITHMITEGFGVLHRVDDPARISAFPLEPDGHLYLTWQQRNGQHRLDGPKFTMSDGDLIWRLAREKSTRVTVPKGLCS